MEKKDLNTSIILIDGLSLDVETLRSKQELIDYLNENGSTHSALMDFCDEYRRQYQNELCWAYPISDGKHLGTFLVLVKEGILSIPYDYADKEDYELFILGDIRMFDAASMDEFIKNWIQFSENLRAAMNSMWDFLTQKETETKSISENKQSKFYNLTICEKVYKVRIIATRYAKNNNLALELVTDDNEPFTSITVNAGVVFSSNSCACIDANNCPWAEKFIQENELGVCMYEYVKSGFCEYPVYEFFLDKITNGGTEDLDDEN